jgi:hypothetical protein
MAGKNLWAWLLGLALIAVGIILGMNPPKKQIVDNPRFADPAATNERPIVALNRPVVTAFKGDLLDGGKTRKDKTVIPFVIGEYITLDAEAQNATEYRWTVDGNVVPDDKGREWSTKKEREFVVTREGELKFAVQVRDKDQVSQPRETSLVTAVLFVEGFEPWSAEKWEERVLTGYTYTVEVDIDEPFGCEEDDYYRFRYLINDRPVMNPEDETEDEDKDGEWCRLKQLTYLFPGPGNYSFKVEIRRHNSQKIEATAALLEPIIVADALLLEFQADPEEAAMPGTPVLFSTFPFSNAGQSQCRFGVKKLGAADFQWIEEDGLAWNSDKRVWYPTEPGIYELRAEVRELGQEHAQDFRRLQYVIRDGDF